MSIHIHEHEECPECGGDAVMTHDTNTGEIDYICEDPLCENANEDLPGVQRIRFLARLRDDDFAVGDSFWIEGFQFTVTEKEM